MLTFGDVIKAHRRSLGLSLKQMAKLVKKDPKADPKDETSPSISSQYLHDVEQGQRGATDDTIESFAKVFGVDPDYLRVLAGKTPKSVIAYLEAYPDAAIDVADLFRRAAAQKFTAWGKVCQPPVKHNTWTAP